MLPACRPAGDAHGRRGVRGTRRHAAQARRPIPHHRAEPPREGLRPIRHARRQDPYARQRRQGVPVRRCPAITIARQEPTVWPRDHRRRGRPDRDTPHPHLLVAIAPPNGSRQLTDAEAGLYNTMQVRQARAYIVHRAALRTSLPGTPEPSPTLTCLLLRSCVHHCPPIRLARQEIGQVPAQARRSPQRRHRRRRSDHRRRSPIMEV
jgi:hypothetical protein